MAAISTRQHRDPLAPYRICLPRRDSAALLGRALGALPRFVHVGDAVDASFAAVLFTNRRAGLTALQRVQ